MANGQETTGEYVDGIVLNGIEHDIHDITVSELAQSIDDEVIARQRAVSEEATARQNADNQLTTQISSEATARQNADNQLATSVNLLGTSVASLSSAVESAVNDVNDIKSIIPSQASSSNKLADQNYVENQIDTAITQVLNTNY